MVCGFQIHVASATTTVTIIGPTMLQHCSRLKRQTIVDVDCFIFFYFSFCYIFYVHDTLLLHPVANQDLAIMVWRTKREAGLGRGGGRHRCTPQSSHRYENVTSTHDDERGPTTKVLQHIRMPTAVDEASAPVLQHMLTAQKRIVLQHVNPTKLAKCYSTHCLVVVLQHTN